MRKKSQNARDRTGDRLRSRTCK